jgi:hypothetical protein
VGFGDDVSDALLGDVGAARIIPGRHRPGNRRPEIPVLIGITECWTACAGWRDWALTVAGQRHLLDW